jgi:hypothetical protein
MNEKRPIWVKTRGPNGRHTTVVREYDTPVDAVAEAVRRHGAALDEATVWQHLEAPPDGWRERMVKTEDWQEVIEGRVEQKVYTTQLQAGDIVLPSRVKVLQRPRPADEPGKTVVVTTGDGGSDEPTTRRWKTSQRLNVERPV